jgi:hypothetical protein
MTRLVELDPAIEAALHAVERALTNDMQTADGASAMTQLEQLRGHLQAIRARGALEPNELRTLIRWVAEWAPEDDVTLLGALGVIAQVPQREA